MNASKVLNRMSQDDINWARENISSEIIAKCEKLPLEKILEL